MSTGTLEALDQEFTGLFRDVTQVMWKGLAPILGIGITQHLFRQGVSKNLGQYTWLKAIEFTEEGPRLGTPDGTVVPTGQVEIRGDLAAVVKTVLDILTGDLRPTIEDFVKCASFEAPQTLET